MTKMIVALYGNYRAFPRIIARLLPKLLIQVAQANDETFIWNWFAQHCSTSREDSNLNDWLQHDNEIVIKTFQTRDQYLQYRQFVRRESPFIEVHETLDCLDCMIVEPADEYDLERYNLL